MNTAPFLTRYFDRLASVSAFRWEGTVTQVIGQLIESGGPYASAGDACQVVNSRGQYFSGEIVGFRGQTVLTMTHEPPASVRYGDRVVSWGQPPKIAVGDALIGRTIDALGQPLDSLGDYRPEGACNLQGAVPAPLERELIREPLALGVRAIDAFMTCGEGQRLGIFGGSGVGKSTLLGMMARNTSADVTVLALIGERGREVREFLEHSLGEQGRRKAIVVVSTSDQSPLLRLRGAFAATAIAEHFASQGKRVLLFVDSLTRLAMAQREIALAAGEPPTSKGYTPSVFGLMARLIERAGKFRNGSITGFYTVLMEGDDQQDPIVDAARALLDGHVMLDRKLATQNHYPAIAILDSISRLMPAVCSREHLEKAAALRKSLASYRASEDLVRIGAYQSGNDADLDVALKTLPALNAFLQQGADEYSSLDETRSQLIALGE